MSNAIGTLAWMKDTQGFMSPQESRAMMMKVIHAQLTLIPDEWLHQLGFKKPQELRVNFEELLPPDTEGALRARQLCREFSLDYLFNHCERSYYWGRILGLQTGVQPDPELLYIACMMHDMGVTETLGGDESREGCFTLIGAECCENLGTELSWSRERIDLLSEAITLHMNVGVDVAYGPEAHLLNLATTLDTTELRLWRVPKPMAREVIEHFPRLDQNETLPPCICQEAKRFPHTRMGWLEKRVQLGKRISKARFDL